jgi:hypothetical protein
MSGINNGPAITNTPNSVATLTPNNTTTNSNPQEANQIRVLASGKGLNVNVLGDIGVLPVVNSNRWNVQAVIATNLTANPGTSVAIAVCSAPLGAAVTIVAPVVLSSLVGFGGATVAYRPVVQNVSFVGNGQTIYVSCQTTAGTACTLDVYVLGYDLSV